MHQDLNIWFLGMLFIFAWLGSLWIWGYGAVVFLSKNEKGIEIQQPIRTLSCNFHPVQVSLHGLADGWNAWSGYYYNEVNDTRHRFLPEPFGCNDTSIPGRSGNAACSGLWYFWKLRPDQVTILSNAIVWVCYSLHQIFVWILIYRAQLLISQKPKAKPKFQKQLRWFNWSLLLVNALFHVLHLVQAHWTYDGTAQNTIIGSSQGSVIMMICVIMLMEYKDRGIITMWPNPKSTGKFTNYLRLSPGPIELVRKYHGIAFSWASIYTFWYHPAENTWAHATGFFHTGIVLLQGSLIYTEMHRNKYWRLLNETWVLLHGTVVALQTGDPNDAGKSMWPTFAFGFGFVFAFTQVYGLPIWRKISPWFRVVPIVAFITIVCILYGTVVKSDKPDQSGFARFYEMFFIPAELYVMCILTWVFLYVFLKIEAKLSPKRKTIEQTEVSATKQALFVGCSALVYALFILISLLLNNATLNFVVMMIVFVLIFCFGVSVTIMFFKQVMGPFRNMVGKVSPKAEVKFDISHTITTSENPDTSCNTISQSHLQNKD